MVQKNDIFNKHTANKETMQSEKHKPRKQMQQKNAAYPVHTDKLFRPQGETQSGTVFDFASFLYVPHVRC